VFKVQYPNASKLKQVVQALAKISDELQLQVTLEAFNLMALSPDKTMMAVLTLPNLVFEEYSVEEETTILVPALELKRVIRRTTRNDIMQISVNKETNELIIVLRDRKSGLERELAVPIIPRPPEPVPELELELSVTFAMLSQDLKNIVGDLKLVGEEATFIYEPGKIVIRSTEQRKEYTCELREGNPLTILSSAVERAQSTYGTDMLVAIAKVASASKQVIVSFDIGKPMKVEYELAGGGRLVYWIVPRV